ncbi:MAG: SAM-dependent methyltransferase [Paludibacteraceae bacterium]
MNLQTKDFIQKYVNEDVNILILKSVLSADVDIPLAIKQIEGMQKIKDKVPMFYRCAELLYPPKLSLEQCSSEITARYKSSLCRGKKMVDLTGGFGIDTFFMSENFDETIYVERQQKLCELAEHNFAVLSTKNIKIQHETSEVFLETDFVADWIYIDPARRKDGGAKAVLLSDCEPDVTELQDKLLTKAPNVMIKLSPMFDLAQLQRELKNIREIHIIAVENECKEILVLLERDYHLKVTINAVHFQKNKNAKVLTFHKEEEKNTIVNYTETVLEYLYEPNAAILKSGAFRTSASFFKLHKLHINSHLYTSNDINEHFQGRIFKVKSVIPFNKEELKRWDCKKANVSVRNFPLSVNELRKKLKLKDGGNEYIFATTLYNNQKVLITCTKI